MRRLALALLLLTPSAAFGDFILSGDSNNVFGTNGTLAGLPAGNARFLRNVLGAGTSVQIVRGSFGEISANVLNDLYNSTAGVSSTINLGPITSLAGVNLLVIDLPDAALSSSSAALVRSFEASGGTVLLIGENSTVDPAPLTATLEAIGSTLRLVPTLADGGTRFATVANGQVVADPLTAGVDNYLYGGAGISLVTGGKAVILASDLRSSFVSVERRASAIATPEPASLALLGLGLAGLAARSARRRFAS